jgi:hypothetical protein
MYIYTNFVCAITTLSIPLDRWNVKLKKKLQITYAADSCLVQVAAFLYSCPALLHKIIKSV